MCAQARTREKKKAKSVLDEHMCETLAQHPHCIEVVITFRIHNPRSIVNATHDGIPITMVITILGKLCPGMHCAEMAKQY